MAQRFAKEEEVYVIRYEKGIAYVKRWEDVEPGIRDSRDQGLRTQTDQPLASGSDARSGSCNKLCPAEGPGFAMTNSTVLIADMGILVGIFLLGLLAKLFPKNRHKAKQ